MTLLILYLLALLDGLCGLVNIDGTICVATEAGYYTGGNRQGSYGCSNHRKARWRSPRVDPLRRPMVIPDSSAAPGSCSCRGSHAVDF
jgi:hypothetical protein